MSRTKLSKEQSGWDAAIDDAEKSISRLKVAIAVFKENKAKGEPWPTQSENQTLEPATLS